MTYRIAGLEPAPFAPLFALSDAELAQQGAVRLTAPASRGYPCRVSLEDAREGDSLVLLHHTSHDVATPYRSSYAIYVREHAASAEYIDQTPPVFAGRPLGLRGFDAAGMLQDARLALPGEGGHVDLPIGSPREAELWQQLYRQLGHVRAEDVLSGSGLLLLYRAMCALDGHEARLSSPAEVTAAALAGDALAMAVLEQFCVWLGRAAGNNVLSLGARGGVYIVGGVVPRFAEFFLASGFAKSFSDKGCMSDYFKGIPVWLVTAPYSGLTGAGVALEQAFA